MSIPSTFDFEIVHSIAETDPVRWDQLSAGRPFTSHQWYRYGEAVMTDCEPTYLIVHQQGEPIARATFWRTANEPLPIQSAFLRKSIEPLLQRWPLLICRSPLSSISGLVLPEQPLRNLVQTVMSAKANEFLRETGCSFLTLEYLPQKEHIGWPESFVAVSVLDPGTAMTLTWPSFDAYLEASNKKDRQHYKRTLREAEKLGIQVSRHNHVDDIDEALTLVRDVEHRFGSAENPWARAMFEHLAMVDGIFLDARIGSQLVGCGLILQDNGAQMNASLGLAAKIPYVYFMLIYESMKAAFERHIQLLRMGSGAYEVKEQLGFSREDNNLLLFSASNTLLRKTGQLLGKFI